MWYHIAEPNEYLAITGAGIDTVSIKKKSWVFPGQKSTKFSITPFDFSLALQAMTIEKLKFSLPAVFTIGPDDNIEALRKYAVLLTSKEDEGVRRATVAVGEGRGHVQDIVKGVIEGETRSIVSTMTMEELFKERRIFRDKVIKNVQSELDQFGLKIYNANVKELQDTAGSEYFAYLSRKAHEGALNQAKVDVADARMHGDVGEAERQGKTKQDIAKINATTAVLETERKAEKAQAEAALTDKEIHIEKELNLSRIIAKNAAAERDAELQKKVEQKRAEAELERQRATTVTKAVIDRESAQEKAQAALYTQQKAADGKKAQQLAETDAGYYRITKEAEASKVSRQMEAEASKNSIVMEAEATKIAKQMAADAHYYAQKQEAEGLIEMSKAYGAMANVLGGPQGSFVRHKCYDTRTPRFIMALFTFGLAQYNLEKYSARQIKKQCQRNLGRPDPSLLQYMMVQNNTFEKLALANAKAINGLAPKINVWNTGAQEGGVMDPTAPIRNLMQSLPPLLSTINDQTGIQPPAWLMQMPKNPESEVTVKKNSKLTNGHGV